MNQSLTILTYNLYFGRAFGELLLLANKHKPDIICVREFPVSEEVIEQLEKNGYELADYSHSFFKHFRIYSVATFYNPKKIKYANTSTIDFARSFYELALFILRLSKTARSALTNNFVTRSQKKSFQVCNVHLTALQSTNKVRMKQLYKTFQLLNGNSKTPTIVTGDFNYVYKRKALETFFHKQGYKEATNNLLYTIETRLLWLFKIKMKPDYIWYKRLKKIQTKRFSRRFSDHFPVLAKFEL